MGRNDVSAAEKPIEAAGSLHFLLQAQLDATREMLGKEKRRGVREEMDWG